MIYFISDIHLGYYSGEKNKAIERLLVSFFDAIAQRCQVLVIAGDLFDFWFDYRFVVPKHFFKTISKLYELKEKGIEIIYLMGNHDFGHYTFFSEELGIAVIEEDLEREFFGKKFYISHGDGKIQGDFGYRILKSILRNGFSRSLFRLIHPDLGILIAKNSSHKSRSYTTRRAQKDFDSLFEFAKLKIDEGFDYVIMGHSHKSEFRSYKNGYYVNLGDWLSNPLAGSFDGKEMQLVPITKIIENKIKA
ncbi:MAG: UDP-2,3-diacylglucosamine diphosphatase [Candidatus Kapaibacteriota bacterium]